MIKWFLTGLLLSMQLMTSAQQISGKITNANGKPVQGVHLYCKGNTVGVVTDANGWYTFDPVAYCNTLIISHVEYQSQELLLSELRVNSNIVLKNMTYDIDPVDIYSKPVITLLPDTPLFINDYEIAADRIYLCAFTNRSLNKPTLLYTDLNGKIIDSESLSSTGDLYVDPDKWVYIIQKDIAYQLIPENDQIYFSESFDANFVINAREHWTHTMGDSLILRYYYYRNQGMGYFLRVLPDDSARIWLEFVDEDAIDRMSWGGFFDGNEFDNRFEEMIVYKPVQIPIFLKKDSIIAFNFITWTIQYMNHEGEIGREVPMTYGPKNNLKTEVYFDEYSGKYYGREIRGGLNRLIEIDINNGTMAQSFTFKGYPHIEKLKVSDGVLYFLYKDYAGDQYKRLYKSPLVKMVAEQ